MADPARKLSPEEQEYYGKMARNRPIDGIQKPVQSANIQPPELLTSDEEPSDDEYESPDLQLLDENEDDDNQQYSNEDQQDDGSNIDLLRRRPQTPEQQIQQGKVPDYRSNDVFQQPGVKEAQPGGPAIKPKLKTDTQSSLGNKTAQQAGGAARNGVSKAANAAGKAAAEAAKKASQAVTKFVTQTLAKLAAQAIAALAPYWFPILMIVIAIIIIITGAVFLFKALQTPNANGSSPVQAADIIGDHALLQTVLTLSSTSDFTKMLNENKSKLISDIDDFITKIDAKYPNNSDPRVEPTKTKLEEVKKLLAAYTEPNDAKAIEIKNKLTEAIKPWAITLDPNHLIYPISGFNNTNKGNGSDYGTKNPKRPDHRGIDRGVPVGTILRSPADSEIVYLVENECTDNVDTGKGNDCNDGFGNTIIGKVTAPGEFNGYFWEMHHIKKGSASTYKVSKGSTVKQGQIIAQSGDNGSSTVDHLHFQIDKPEAATGGFPVGKGRLGQTRDPYEVLGWSR